MKKSAIVLLVFSLIFVVATLVFFVFSTIFGVTSLVAYFDPNGTAGDKVGSVFLFIAMIPYCAGMFLSGALTLPFDLALQKKLQDKTWYTKAILIFALVAMALAIIYVIVFPLSVNATTSANSSSSMSSSI